jgi:hypothetical protein
MTAVAPVQHQAAQGLDWEGVCQLAPKFDRGAILHANWAGSPKPALKSTRHKY